MSQVGEELNELSDNLIQAQLEKKEECEWESEEWDKSEEEWESSDKEWEESDKEWEESDKEWEESDKEWEQSDKECEELEEEGMMEHEQFCEEEEDLGKEYWKENFDESDASEDLDCERSTRHSMKFCRPWLGPFKVIKIMSPNVYQIVDCSNPQKWKVVHFNRFKPAPESMDNEGGQSQQHVSTEMPKASSKRPAELQDEEDEGEYIYYDIEGPNTDAAPAPATAEQLRG
ncbi:hypothetical protein EMCRGX_G009259 [Ephydatia muelleri]